MKRALLAAVVVIACAIISAPLAPQRAQIKPGSNAPSSVNDENKLGDLTSVIDSQTFTARSRSTKSHRSRTKVNPTNTAAPALIEEDEEEVHQPIYSYRDQPGDSAIPTSPPTNADESLLSDKERTSLAPGDMDYFRVHDLTAAEAPARSVISEPSVVNLGSGVFYTANHYAAKSLDGGVSFTYVNPAIFPPVNNGFCCDQVTSYAPNQDMVLWGLQYQQDASTNTFRIARTIGVSGLSNNQWLYWNFTPQSFGLSTGLWLDFPNISTSNGNLYLTSNIFTISGGTFAGSVIWRLSLAELAAGSINYSYLTLASVGSLRLTEGAGATMHWVATDYTTPSVRIYDWADASGTITSRNVAVSTFNPLSCASAHNCNGVAVSPDGTNWAGGADSRILGAYVANGVVGAMWGARQGGAFSYPYTIHARFNESTGALISQTPVWNGSFAWLYPTASVNAAHDLGGAVGYGGGTYYPNTAIWTLDDIENSLPLGGVYAAIIAANGPSQNKWGDYLTVKPHNQYPNTWVAGIYGLAGGQGDANAVSRYLWFGRERNGPGATSPRRPFDYDGDGRSDVSVFRPSNRAWYLQQSTNGFRGVSFGNSTDKIAPADFDGDGKTDVAVYRPATATWYWLNSSTGTLSAMQFGAAEDLPAAADYDGDGHADVSVFRPSNGVWYRLNSSNGSFTAVQFGATEDKPTIGDYDGDGHADVAVFRPSAWAWYRLNSSNGAFVGTSFGLSDDVITPADFDGDGKTDVAVYRPSSGTWFSLNSSNGALVATPFGTAEDVPTAADFDGDGRADVALFRPSNGVWYRLNSGNGSFFAVQFGTAGDRPTPAAFRY
jgi:hypothetical protein